MYVFKGPMPDITPAQIIGAILGAIYPFLTLVGVDLDADQRDALDKLWAIALGLFGADAALRVGRNMGTGGVVEDPYVDFMGDEDLPSDEEEQTGLPDDEEMTGRVDRP